MPNGSPSPSLSSEPSPARAGPNWRAICWPISRPPRCNAPATPWLRSSRLGEVVARVPGGFYTARVLEGLAAAADVDTNGSGFAVRSGRSMAFTVCSIARSECETPLQIHGDGGPAGLAR